MVPKRRFELPTYALRMRCTTAVLLRHLSIIIHETGLYFKMKLVACVITITCITAIIIRAILCCRSIIA